jgi:hypothetical protein|nr:MAG TPA: hypothetical protein [Bacteriophage sp.]
MDYLNVVFIKGISIFLSSLQSKVYSHSIYLPLILGEKDLFNISCSDSSELPKSPLSCLGIGKR